MPINQCRSCAGTHLRRVLELGNHPLVDALPADVEQALQESRYPLTVVQCADCSLLQVTETIPPQTLFQMDYPYFSSSSPSLLAHSAATAELLIDQRRLDASSLVIEVACNDGYLLRNFVKRGIPCLGIDPAEGPALKAQAEGIAVVNDFFSFALAERLAGEGRQADVMIANNVVAHVDQINDFVAGFARLLKHEGIAVLECAYALDMVEKCEFDTIYHEHLFYHTLHSLVPLFERHGLHINHAERLPVHGGSLRIWVGRGSQSSAMFGALMEEERAIGVPGIEWLTSFSDRVHHLGDSLRELLVEEKRRGKRIACYGAAAKGATLLNFIDLGPGFFDFVADANPFKQGRLMPGQHVPIVHPDRLLQEQPDFVLLLAWNFAGEVLRQQAAYRAAGGRFVVPIPELRVIGPDEVVHENHYALPTLAVERDQNVARAVVA